MTLQARPPRLTSFVDLHREGVMFDVYLAAYRAAVIRKHRRRWSWKTFRWVCRCGESIPCPNFSAVLAVLDDGR
jgi:hypothetical protein